MNKPFAPKAAPLSYNERPRLDRALQHLPSDQRDNLVAALNDHLENNSIQSLQRRGQYLYVTIAAEKGEDVRVYDFAAIPNAQSCLTALTDCLRTGKVPVRVLMPQAPPTKD